MRALRGFRVPRTSRTALAAPRGSIPSGSNVALSLCGTGTQVHGPKEAGEVYSCSLASCTTQPLVSEREGLESRVLGVRGNLRRV